jgi:hypothetical protein
VSDALAEIQTRLSAIEIFLCHTLSNCLAQSGQAEDIDRIHRELLRKVERANIIELSPMYADCDLGDLDYAIRCLIATQRRIMGLRGRPQP